ncbi:insertion element protein [Planococcus sp. ISL-110]|uniref:insertion element protein n=1 Tax=Planococcus sp. ISL-110 TaxID=2819167 RepID=UPI001BE6A2E1|nr:insertion element protein [Planococcus sp. ISL-110]MBT2571615.1 insertion element protein [Planococcus sp. ISL-110]
MVKIKRLANFTDRICLTDPNIPPSEITQRHHDYLTLSDKKMKTQNVKFAFRPTDFTWKGKTHEIQLNFCANPFCKNHLQPQTKYGIGKNQRYTITGTTPDRNIICNADPNDPNGIPTLNCNTKAYSNWSLATEIERLVRLNSVVPLNPVYHFHKDGCANPETFLTQPKTFYKRGKASSNAQIVQCKTCKKYTNILPTKAETTSYHQKRNDILPVFADMIIQHIPVSSTCKVLKIGRSTYYEKLEWLYRCCLEFLETREKAFEKKVFPRIWVNTDMMMYVLNNVRKKGQTKKFKRGNEKQLPTQVVISSDMRSRYVFRADVAYDWDVTFNQIKFDTITYKDDHLTEELRKNAKFTQHSYFPQPPSPNDLQTMTEYHSEMIELNRRKEYVDGLHVNHTYTAMAQMFLIKKMVKTPKWRFVSDDDRVLKLAIRRIFAEEMKNGRAQYLVSNFDKTLSREEAYKEFIESGKYLQDWAETRGMKDLSHYEKAVAYLKEKLAIHKFYETKTAPDGTLYNIHKPNKIEHPIAMADRGSRYINVLSDTSKLSDEHLARLIVKANDNSVNTFLQEIRRSISILERPLVTSRGDGKSYIYSNFNPKYAQMSITILRTYYNFCKTYQVGKPEIGIDGKKIKKLKTPAQRLGIADKIYTWEDIIYKR